MKSITQDPTKEINRLYQKIGGEIFKAAGQVFQENYADVIRLGELLTEQKKALPYGKFGSWLKKNTPFSQRSAYNYMGAYAHRNDPDVHNVASLAAIYGIRDPELKRKKRALKPKPVIIDTQGENVDSPQLATGATPGGSTPDDTQKPDDPENTADTQEPEDTGNEPESDDASDAPESDDTENDPEPDDPEDTGEPESDDAPDPEESPTDRGDAQEDDDEEDGEITQEPFGEDFIKLDDDDDDYNFGGGDAEDDKPVSAPKDDDDDDYDYNFGDDDEEDSGPPVVEGDTAEDVVEASGLPKPVNWEAESEEPFDSEEESEPIMDTERAVLPEEWIRPLYLLYSAGKEEQVSRMLQMFLDRYGLSED